MNHHTASAKDNTVKTMLIQKIIFLVFLWLPLDLDVTPATLAPAIAAGTARQAPQKSSFDSSGEFSFFGIFNLLSEKNLWFLVSNGY